MQAHIGMDKLTERQKQVLKELVEFTCQECGIKTDKLEAHRIKRANKGGKYTPNNIKMVCEDCHLKYHWDEFK